MKTILHNPVIKSEDVHDSAATAHVLPLEGSISGSEAPVCQDATHEAGGRDAVICDDQLLVMFLESLQANTASANTVRAYGADIRRFMDFTALRGRRELVDLQSSDINLFLRQLTLEDASASTVRRTRAALKKFFRFHLENGTIASNPFEGALLEEALSDRLTLSSIISMALYLQRRSASEGNGGALRYRRDELILLLMLIYGIRQYHVPGLKLSAMKKEGRSVLLAVSEECSLRLEGIVLTKFYHYLRHRDSKSDIIFVEPDTGKPVAARTLHSLMIELSYAVRVQVNPRTLHHTFLHLHRDPGDASQLLHNLAQLEEENYQ
ncbi:MAG: site-specific integrase [Bacteroidetes bacterium]|nr:site-specific integrase [Bacteroidota bacterium]MCW5896703.1 site-specific integrase [Bacteroidota bacterium]